jgi:hypothetical protein
LAPPYLAAAALLLPLAAALGCLGGGVRCTPHRLYKGGPRRGGNTQVPRAPPHLGRPPPPPSAPASPGRRPPPSPAWHVEGLHRWEITPPLHAVVLWSNFRIPVQRHLLPQSCWNGDSESHRDHHTCASMQRCHSCGAGVVAPRSS